MKIFTINPDSQTIEEVETEIKANSIYTFFTSILIDEITTLNRHVIYSDANALSNKKRAYFLGEQLLLGDAIIIGRDGMQEIDVSIRKDELNELINYDVPKFYQETLELLSNSDINLYREFICEKDGEKIGLNTEWVLYTFNIADQRTKDYFIDNLKQTLDNKADIEKYIQKMAQLALNASN
jgi:hypothetical protein